MYKVRCSSLDILFAGCGKVNNKYEWKDLSKINESHIKLAIEIYNKANGLFVPAEVCTLDMNTGSELEPDAIKMYDSFFNTNYFPDYEECRNKLLDFEAENEWITGTRDFGNIQQTIDCKISTNKNVFDLKKFTPVEVGYTIQVNGYGWLYGTKILKLYNCLMPASFGQIKKFVDSKGYIEMLSDEQRFAYEEVLEASYNYDLIAIEKRINVKIIPQIENFQDITKKRVEVLNEWIEKNKHSI